MLYIGLKPGWIKWQSAARILYDHRIPIKLMGRMTSMI